MKNLCALYLRVSTDNQADHGVSLPAQQSRLMSYIKAQNWNLFKIYKDDGYSGKNLDRPAIKQLLIDAKLGKFNRVVVIKLDRLSRSQKDALYLIEDIFNANDVSFHSVSESFDTSTPFGKASLGMLSVFAQLEREMIVDRILVAKKECAKQGRYLGGFVPYGYIYDNILKKYVLDPITAHTVRLIYDTYSTGQFSFSGICEKLDFLKIPTHKHAPHWDKTTIKQILLNPVYIGKVRHKGQIHDGLHEPIISQEQFDLVTTMIKKQYVKPPTKEENNLLVGFIYCGNCGARMRYKNHNWNTAKKTYNQQYYICYTQYGYKNMVTVDSCDCGFKKAQEVNQAVIHYLFALASTPRNMDAEIKKAITGDLEPNNGTENIKLELTKIHKKMTRWYDAYENDNINKEQLTERINRLCSQQTELETRIKMIDESKNQVQQSTLSTQAVNAQLLNLPKLWATRTSAERRAALARLISKVTVFKDNTIDVDLMI